MKYSMSVFSGFGDADDLCWLPDTSAPLRCRSVVMMEPSEDWN
jgi:hypothetical protein